ncbi:CDP-glucose 4,6-dehydratase, partial [bacterium]|nr:CDP-glucose 4,6-dehydratase [bacterium]
MVSNLTKDFWNGKRVLLTGHSGFKGSWMTKLLTNLGSIVYGYSLEPNTKPNLFEILNISELCDSTYDDINNFDNLKEYFFSINPDIVFHFAAQPIVLQSYQLPIDTFKTNVIGLANLLELVRLSNKFVSVLVITSDKCYKKNTQNLPYKESDSLGGSDPYSASKACAEIITESYRDSFFSYKNSSQIATARAGNVIGGGDWSEYRLITDIVRYIWQDNTKLELRYPAAVRPWQHVLEPLNGYINLAEKLYKYPGKYNKAWNFGPTDLAEFKVSDIIKTFEKKLNIDITYSKFNNIKNENAYLSLDSSYSNKNLGWVNKLTTEEAIEWTIDWYQNFYEGSDSISFT